MFTLLPGDGDRGREELMQANVKVEQGLLSGLEDGGVYRFLGVPYAAPPVGPLRWCPPAPALTWDGVRKAENFGLNAVQTVGAGFVMRQSDEGEDCLTLNIWTASLNVPVRRPVMVWIHGGGNLGGAGSEDAFDGASLAAHGAVVVTFNYRLGALGFIAHPSLGANFGVLDYVAALQWVADNIAGFGGDPGNVTIFGESAGAVAVRTLLQCPMARGLFHRAIIQSAGFEQFSFAPGWSYERAATAAEQLFDRLGTRDVDKLREVPIEQLKLASHELSGVFPKPGHVHTPANLVWMPAPDGEIVVEEGFPGWPEDVPVMFGTLENEARYFIKPGGTYPPELLRIMAEALCGPRSDDILALFAHTDLTPYECLDKLFSGVIWIEPALATAKRFADMGRRFYTYHFARVSPGARQSGDLVRHSAEIRYVFGNLTDDGAYDAVDRAVSDGMQHAWLEFARTGVPRSPDGTAWPAYSTDNPQQAYIADSFGSRPYEITELTSIIHSLRR
ncbi:MAG: hypothetical protein RLZZ366_1821 [Pseudomonadota bacterium]